MHNRETIDANVDIIADVTRFFSRSLDIAARAGIARQKIVLDPGIGFGKTPEQSMALLRAIRALTARVGVPLMIGVSRKAFIGYLTGKAATERQFGTAAAVTAAVLAGAAAVRVHDVGATRDIRAVAERLVHD
jgi:dihydropteroate synthase